MNRGAVIIGIDKYAQGGLLQLKAAVSGAKEVASWAQSNGIEVKLLTDENGPVTFTDVRKSLFEFVERGGVRALHQLIVYFAGHGINKGWNSEYWLLSEAPKVTSEAVNLSGTVDIARGCSGIRHVVFVSDACRTAADSINALAVEGGEPFPNLDRDVPPAEIDRFYAAAAGHPSQEVKTPRTPSQTTELSTPRVWSTVWPAETERSFKR